MEFFYRSPRFWREIKPYRLRIDLPPPIQTKEETPLWVRVGPAMTMGMASVTYGIYGFLNGSKISAVTSGCLLVGTVVFPIFLGKYEKRRAKKQEAYRQEKYRAYLHGIQEELQRELEKQWEIRWENGIDTEQCRRRILQKSRNLWERSPRENDFLKLRVGTGDTELLAEVQIAEQKFSLQEDALLAEAYALANSPRIIKNVPIRVSLLEDFVIGIIGQKEHREAFANGLILQLTALYGYDEVKLVFLTENKEFGYTRWLPHVWDAEKKQRFFACAAEDTKALARIFGPMFEQKKNVREGSVAWDGPYYIVFALERNLAIRSDFVGNICKNQQNIGCSVLYFCDALRFLPKECSRIIDLRQPGRGELYHRTDTQRASIVFCPDIYQSVFQMQPLAKQLANTFLDDETTKMECPQKITFLELFSVGCMKQLQIKKRWEESNPMRSLSVPVGVDQFGEVFSLDLHESSDGPHGLVAGMTGSGKSEFLITFLLSLAVCFHPHEVSFVLIDYKGGGMAKALDTLPHTAGVITNLDGSSVWRSLLSIQSELQRRQRLFADVGRSLGQGNPDIYKYQKWYRQGLVKEPLSHLLLVCDEFAELKTQQSEFMTQLIRTARIGRSLGVHLILATQKPGGVVDDQIWSNARFRLCLKVQDKGDSMDMLKRPEAATLTETGRFYLQIGYNESFRMGQAAWAGAAYVPREEVQKHREQTVFVLDTVGNVLAAAKPKEGTAFAQRCTQMEAVIKEIKKVAKEERAYAHALWPEPLPKKLTIQALEKKFPIKRGDEIAPVIGLYDDPANQKQHTLRLLFEKEGNAVVYGMAQSGKTAFVLMTVYALLTQFEPTRVQLYILDFSTELFGAFLKAPHVGDVVFSYEAEKVHHLFRMLRAEVQKRKQQMAMQKEAEGGAADAQAGACPLLLVIIHGMASFAEQYEEELRNVGFLMREGTRVGIYFLVTATGVGALGFRLVQHIKQIFVLQMTESSEYAAALGRMTPVFPEKIKGRGLVNKKEVLEFQVATPFETEQWGAPARRLCDELRQTYSVQAKRIPVLPDVVRVDFLRTFLKEKSLCVPVGIDTQSLEPLYVSFEDQYVTPVLSQGEEWEGFLSALEALLVLTGVRPLCLDGNRLTPKEAMVAVTELFEEVLRRHNERKNKLKERCALPIYETKLVLLRGFSALRQCLDEQHKEMMDLILLKGSVQLNLHIVLADTAGALSGCSYERWFQKSVSASDGIWIGNGISQQFLLKIGKTTVQMMEAQGRSFGFVIKNGRAHHVKLPEGAT